MFSLSLVGVPGPLRAATSVLLSPELQGKRTPVPKWEEGKRSAPPRLCLPPAAGSAPPRAPAPVPPHESWVQERTHEHLELNENLFATSPRDSFYSVPCFLLWDERLCPLTDELAGRGVLGEGEAEPRLLR